LNIYYKIALKSVNPFAAMLTIILAIYPVFKPDLKKIKKPLRISHKGF
jgi:hypothetical protein